MQHLFITKTPTFLQHTSKHKAPINVSSPIRTQNVSPPHVAWTHANTLKLEIANIHEFVDDLGMTWMRMTVWPLERRFSVAHLIACWLALSLSMATATSPLRPPFRPIILAFPFGSHIVQIHAQRKLWKFNPFDLLISYVRATFLVCEDGEV